MEKNTNITDLTEGNVLHQLVKFAVPVILMNLLQTFYNIIDMYVVSIFIGTGGVSALTNASQIAYVITNVIIGLSLGGNIMIGQYFGRGDKKNQDETTGSFLTLFAVLGIIFTAVFILSSRSLLRAMNTPAEVLDQANIYLMICSSGIFFIYMYNALTSILRAVGNTRKPLHFIIAATVVNLVLDLLFVGLFKMGIGGAALATVISQALSFVLALYYLLRQKSIFIFSFAALYPRLDKIKYILKIGIPTAIQMTIAGLSFIIVTYFINGYGVIISAGNGLSSKIRDVCLMYINSMLAVTSSMIAQNIGKEKYERAKETMFTSMKVTFFGALILVIIVELTAPYLMLLFRATPEVAAAGAYNLRIEILAQLAYAIFLIFHALMTGAGHTLYVLGSSFVNCILFRAVLAFVFNYFFGLTGVFVALALAPVSSIPIGYIYYKSNIWRRSLAARN